MDDLSHLSDREHVRKRPGMYIGNTMTLGLHHCVYELIDYANDRNASRISVSLNANGGVTVTDDGKASEPETLERSMTDLQFDPPSKRKDNAGLHGVGPVVVNFLASNCSVESLVGGAAFRQSYRCGVAVTPVERVGNASEDGMSIFVLPDADIFKTTELRYDKIEQRLQELSYLRVGVRYSLFDERTLVHGEFYSERGAYDFVCFLNRNTEPLHPAIALNGQAEGITFDIAFQYNTSFREQMFSYGNETRSYQDGQHVLAYQHSLVRVLQHAGESHGIPLDAILDTETYYAGLTSVVAVRLKNPLWQGATRTRLANEELLSTITTAVDDYLHTYFEEHPTTAKAILQKILQSAEVRKIWPPIDYYLFAVQQRRLTLREEDLKGSGATAWLPEAYRLRMMQRNGGEIRTQTEVWRLFPVRDESNEESLQRTRNDLVERSLEARGKSGIPSDAAVIANNPQGDLLLFIRRTDRSCGEDYPNPFADTVYRWDHVSNEIEKIADDFDEICWGPDSQ